jgi:hypothetical protein
MSDVERDHPYLTVLSVITIASYFAAGFVVIDRITRPNVPDAAQVLLVVGYLAYVIVTATALGLAGLPRPDSTDEARDMEWM